MLRLNKLTINQAAQRIGVTGRTIRRDLEMLQAVPLPIRSIGSGNALDPRVFWIGSVASWPRNEGAPVSVPFSAEAAV